MKYCLMAGYGSNKGYIIVVCELVDVDNRYKILHVLKKGSIDKHKFFRVGKVLHLIKHNLYGINELYRSDSLEEVMERAVIEVL